MSLGQPKPVNRQKKRKAGAFLDQGKGWKTHPCLISASQASQELARPVQERESASEQRQGLGLESSASGRELSALRPSEHPL